MTRNDTDGEFLNLHELVKEARLKLNQFAWDYLVGGTETDIRIQARQILTLKKVLADRTAFHTGQTVERIEADSDRDRWFSADEAKDYGLVDHVVRSANEVPTEGPVS